MNWIIVPLACNLDRPVSDTWSYTLKSRISIDVRRETHDMQIIYNNYINCVQFMLAGSLDQLNLRTSVKLFISKYIRSTFVGIAGLDTNYSFHDLGIPHNSIDCLNFGYLRGQGADYVLSHCFYHYYFIVFG